MASRRKARPGSPPGPTGRAAPRRRRRTGKRTLHYLLLLIFMLAAGVILSLTVFFQIEDVAVIGVDKYEPDDVVEASGVQVGDNLLRLDTQRIEQEMTKAFPYIESVRVERRFPPRVELIVTQSVPQAAAVASGEVVFITLEGKILERGDLLVPPELPIVRGLSLQGAEPGTWLGGEEDPENEERLVMLRYLFEAAENTGFTPMTNVDVRDRLNIKIIHEARLILELGSEADLEYKLTFLRSVIENEIRPDAQALLDAANARDKQLIRKDGKVVNGEFFPDDSPALEGVHFLIAPPSPEEDPIAQ